jgi:hypothetical protein
MVTDIMQRRKEFDRPLETLEMLNLFGKNVSAVEGQEWQRQRGIASIPFDEQNNSLARAESLR